MGCANTNTTGPLLFSFYVNDLFTNIDHQPIMHGDEMRRMGTNPIGCDYFSNNWRRIQLAK